MALNRVECPECGAGLKSPSGFEAGQSVECPKCETYFTVSVPESDDDDERPVKKKVRAASRDDDDDDTPRKKKKKHRDDDGEKSYKNSPMRFAVLGILVTVMVVLGVMLYMKRQRDKEAEDHNAQVNAEEKQNIPAVAGGPVVRPDAGPPMLVEMNPGGFPKLPGGGPFPKNPGGPFPKNPGGGPLPKNPGGGFNMPAGGPTGGDGMFAETPWEGSPESKKLLESLRQKLIGTWQGTAPDGATHVVTYQANGQFTHTVNGQAKNGTWQASKLVGGKVLKITRGPATLKVVFEKDELLHDTETPGESIVLKKK